MSAWVPDALEDLQAALSGASPPLEFLPGEGDAPRWVQRPELADSGAAAVVRTSGSTGTPKETLLSAENLRASAEAAAEHLGGHGQWLLTLQPSYVAGLAVLSRSLQAGTEPAVLLEQTTDSESFAEAAAQLTHQRRYVSLVPTQLQRLLGHVSTEAGTDEDRLLAVLRRFDAILLGGGATSPALFGRAQQLGLTVIRTYGMSETAGGCVYDGVPLPGVTVETEAAEDSAGTDDAGVGPVLLSGPMVALGYTDPALTAARFGTDAQGQPQYRTDDLGRLSPEGRLSITGRADDVINTGGVKVSAERIRQVLEADPQVSDAFVAGVAHPEWGQQVVAAVVLSAGLDTEALRRRVREALGPAAAPKQFRELEALPRLANGKPDRQELLRLVQSPPAPPAP
ncbi:AMP-binding protein [Nesterenkonia cremea]|uniref:O-succinylbenzoic acid--CoA ligase n=1 Tax=Nesterenkonia cremea TaxID=1882340 RepID=A0A917ER49_9MICC|nr:AMP-binding protein [Nesterenkonia cremea]GGE74304.1 O-succinylbenzoic acid--CoA ligase [Nesterenkonia cremea]